MLLRGGDSEKSIKAQLYKLNVYGPGSFFKAHVDTPRGDNMFGSLVVVLPTKHEGGSLVFRHRGQECVFDTAAAVSSEATPHGAFVAFFSDVEHEVLEVKSGYRVTLTYNLYFVDHPKQSVNLGVAPAAGDPLLDVASAMSELLATPSVLPKGGLLAFRLWHKYPITPSKTILSDVSKCLKGADKRLKEACTSLSLKTSLKILYKYQEKSDLDVEVACLFDSYETGFAKHSHVDGLIYGLLYRYKGKCTLTYDFPEEYPDVDLNDRLIKYTKPVLWFNASKNEQRINQFQTKYMAYGNEAQLDTIYHDLYLVVEVQPFEERAESTA
ncbi:hypothetical protein D9613_009833 [Agrocybe pediades]|uniref:Fe2OG dioxygenase domain-containing protein n=1 Tax=Agrocybe pediades TaxID=84607 RepID=A0A8H4QXS0_9AGAR|nr:hypothetical protein D9613_009833 [Agrocybe pediades]